MCGVFLRGGITWVLGGTEEYKGGGGLQRSDSQLTDHGEES